MRPTPPYRLFIGWDAAEMRAWHIAQTSARIRSTASLATERLAMSTLKQQALYTRPTSQTDHGYWDEISGAPMSTGHAIARFLVPYLCGYEGWALFTDGDVIFRHDVAALFALADPRCAVQVVQHQHAPTETVKMTGQEQTRYARKNWSSVMLFHCAHPSNRRLTVELVNTVPGRDLHRFCWLEDAEIGALPPGWNHLVGASPAHPDPSIVHFTSGIPDMPGYEHCEWSDEWYEVSRIAGYHLTRPPKREALSA